MPEHFIGPPTEADWLLSLENNDSESDDNDVPFGTGFINMLNSASGLVGNVGDLVNGKPVKVQHDIQGNTKFMIMGGFGILIAILLMKK